MENDIIKITFSIGKGNDWLKVNLEDFVRALNENLVKRKEGEVFGEMNGGIFTATVKGSTVETVKSYLDPFLKAMKKNGANFFLNISHKNTGEEGVGGTVKGQTVNREKLLTKAILMECSIKDIDKV